MESTSTPRCCGALDDGPDGLDAGGVALRLGHAPLAGPAAVAVHDDRDVARDAVRASWASLSRIARAGQPRAAAAN